MKEETLRNYEGGIGYFKSNARVTVNFFYSEFEDKIESVTDQEGDRVTINAGNATHYGLELAANVAHAGWDAFLTDFTVPTGLDISQVTVTFSVEAAPSSTYLSFVLGISASEYLKYELGSFIAC